ncbi:MAG: hypothetical protein V7L23_15430 [Nostoc sp.]|uniref:hypothetical protein n=1 Tax=Nostoc sp. TaxID=1180 RepID=UPI002FEF4BAE
MSATLDSLNQVLPLVGALVNAFDALISAEAKDEALIAQLQAQAADYVAKIASLTTAEQQAQADDATSAQVAANLLAQVQQLGQKAAASTPAAPASAPAAPVAPADASVTPVAPAPVVNSTPVAPVVDPAAPAATPSVDVSAQ